MGTCKLINAEGEENNTRTYIPRKEKIQSSSAKSDLLKTEISQ